MARIKKWSLLVKRNHSCNLNCLHCYDEPLRKKHGNTQMSYKTLDHIAKLASEYAEEVQWIWHGGEPTLYGSEWYRNAQNIFYKYYNTKFNQTMQSNGILLDNNWAKLSSDFNIDIGVSYDAISQKFVRTEQSIFDLGEKVEVFRKFNKRLGSITVINESNYKNQIEIYEIMKNINSSDQFAFNTIFHTDGSKDHKLEFNSIDDYAEEFAKFYKYWLYDNSTYVERSAMEITKHIAGNREICCNNSDCRNKWIGVGPTGELYPCDMAYPDKYCMGNIMDYESVEDIYNSDSYKLYLTDIQKRMDEHCYQCDYYIYCQGGCNAKHSGVSGGVDGLDKTVCEIFKTKFIKAYDVLRSIDIYSDKINHNVTRLILEHPLISLKEIKVFLESKGYNVDFKYDTSKDGLLKCLEFKIFRLFNVFKGKKLDGHINHIVYRMDINTSIDCNFEMRHFKNLRQDLLEKIYLDNYQNIQELLRG